MKILIFSLSYFPLVGGAEIAVRNITDRIPEIEFDMVTLRFNKKDSEFEKIGNVNVYRIGGGWGYFSKILFVFQATFFALRRKYDLYWAMMTYMLFPIVIGRFLGFRTSYILTLQDGDPFSHVFNRWFILPFRPLLLYGFRHAHKVQAISHFLALWAVQAGYRGKTYVVPNGVDVNRFKIQDLGFKNKEETILVTTSRLVEKNGIIYLIESMKYLPENVKLKIIGSGPLESKLKSHSRIINLESRISFIGEVPNSDVPKYLSEGDIFIRPSLSEGQGISFLEAMASGLPVIATPVGGILDFLKDGETGLLVPPKDPRAIAFQVQKLLSDRILYDKITINARRMVAEKYDWNLIAREMKSNVFNI